MLPLVKAVFKRSIRNSSLIRGSIKLRMSTGLPQTSATKAPGRKLDIFGYTVHYEVVGVGGRPVILLPGAIGSSRTDFAPQLEKLDRNKFTLVAWDPPGYGFSRPPERTFPPDFYSRDATVAARLMKELGHEKYSVIGWSDGGITGLVLAAMCPEQVDKLVVFGAQAYVTEHDLQLIEATRDISKWSDRMKAPMISLYGEAYFQELWSNYCTFYGTILSIHGGDICRKELSKIKCPTLIIHGEKDPLVPREHPAYLLKNIAKSTLSIMPEGKHNLHLRYADQFNKEVTEFIES
ncbi:valacyclovir hydrolase-like isoform X2 [Ornithodoros turicata]